MVHCSNQSFRLGCWKNGCTCRSWYGSTDRRTSSCFIPSPSYSPVFSIELKVANIQIKVHIYYVMPLNLKMTKISQNITFSTSVACIVMAATPPPSIWHVYSYTGAYTRCVINIRPKRHLLVGQQDSLRENFCGRSLM